MRQEVVHRDGGAGRDGLEIVWTGVGACDDAGVGECGNVLADGVVKLKFPILDEEEDCCCGEGFAHAVDAKDHVVAGVCRGLIDQFAASRNHDGGARDEAVVGQVLKCSRQVVEHGAVHVHCFGRRRVKGCRRGGQQSAQPAYCQEEGRQK